MNKVKNLSIHCQLRFIRDSLKVEKIGHGFISRLPRELRDQVLPIFSAELRSSYWALLNCIDMIKYEL